MNIKINEIYYSIQGESSFSGLPCIFIRFTYCNLRCSYCDTEYAFHEGADMNIKDILSKVNAYKCDLVEITGGEPLIQEGCIELISKLQECKKNVLIETGGALPIKDIPKKTHIVLDIKCPSSNMADKNLWENIKHIKNTDEIKFVIGDKKDYQWTKNIIKKYDLTKKCSILISPVYKKMKPKYLVKWILKDNLDVRFQMQIHKEIWKDTTRGV